MKENFENQHLKNKIETEELSFFSKVTLLLHFITKEHERSLFCWIVSSE